VIPESDIATDSITEIIYNQVKIHYHGNKFPQISSLDGDAELVDR
jgi:hypothetical protein